MPMTERTTKVIYKKISPEPLTLNLYRYYDVDICTLKLAIIKQAGHLKELDLILEIRKGMVARSELIARMSILDK